ncbi:MAG: hypothetical protein IJX27_08890 [Clostridia bacterium]|nr:hypothetical protein [Clostridia bacterium]
MKKTKIICTMGPACESEEVLEKMMLSGMNVARFNFSHVTYAEHKRRMDTVKRVREKLGLSWAVYPVMSEEFQSTDVLFYHATRVAKETGLAGKGDAVVITGGLTNGNSGNTSLIKYEILR